MVVKKTGARFECGTIKRLDGRTECPEVEPRVGGETFLSSVLPHLSETRFRTHGFEDELLYMYDVGDLFCLTLYAAPC